MGSSLLSLLNLSTFELIRLLVLSSALSNYHFNCQLCLVNCFSVENIGTPTCRGDLLLNLNQNVNSFVYFSVENIGVEPMTS